jgi:hypothetical protein
VHSASLVVNLIFVSASARNFNNYFVTHGSPK